MVKEPISKYMLVFEPKYDLYQYAIHFGKETSVMKINKYTDTLTDTNKKIISKNTLAEIDLQLTPLPNLPSIFAKYVDPKIFAYNGINLHRIFIGHKYGNYIYTLPVIFNNKELHDKLPLVNGNKIDDCIGREQFITLLLDEKSSFYDFIKVKVAKKEVRMKVYTMDLIHRLRFFATQLNSFCSQDVVNEFNKMRDKLDGILGNYYDYREMFLLHQEYLHFLKQEKNKLNEQKQDIIKIKTKQNKNFGGEGQLSLFDYDPNYVPTNSSEPILKKSKK